jgi:hypothetical protein
MRSQLALIETTNTRSTRSSGSTGSASRFRLDDRTRAMGREGVQAARAALAEAAERRKMTETMLAERQAA